jgi:hypothetical protein
MEGYLAHTLILYIYYIPVVSKLLYSSFYTYVLMNVKSLSFIGNAR